LSLPATAAPVKGASGVRDFGSRIEWQAVACLVCPLSRLERLARSAAHAAGVTAAKGGRCGDLDCGFCFGCFAPGRVPAHARWAAFASRPLGAFRLDERAGQDRADAAFRPLFAEGNYCCSLGGRKERQTPARRDREQDRPKGVRAGTDHPRRKGPGISEKGALMKGKLILKSPPAWAGNPAWQEAGFLVE
jgi:hypothetical protein